MSDPERPAEDGHLNDPAGNGPPGPAGPGRPRAAVLATAATALLGLVLGLAVWAVVSGDGGPPAEVRTGSREHRPPVGSVDWTRLPHPLDCGDLAVRLLDVEVADLTGDGSPEAVVLLRCDAGAGSPPSALFVYDRAPRPGEPPEPAQVLLRQREDVLLGEVAVKAGAVRGTAYTYSGPDVPRCCPDRRVRLTWTWNGSRFDRRTEPAGPAG